MIKSRAWRLVCLILLGSWWGCATPPLSSPPPATPFFSATSEDTSQLALLASDLDTLALECAANNTCDDQVHFSRALISLFENRDAARASFEQVLILHPSSPFAASSALWLQLLRDEGLAASSQDPQRRILIEFTAQGVREWMARQLTVRASRGRTVSLPDSEYVRSLHKKVQERDRRIADLRAQLDALKVIDQEQLDRRKMRQPASLVPRIDNHR